MKPSNRLIRWAALVSAAALTAQAQAAVPPPMQNYCHVPVFVQAGGNVKPNITLFLDNSGSMNWNAYSDSEDYNWRKEYYGYFESDKCYAYNAGTGRFDNPIAAGKIVLLDAADPSHIGKFDPYACSNGIAEVATLRNPFSGNFLNWAAMSRFEVAKKAMTGGRWDGTNILFEDTVQIHQQSPKMQLSCIDPHNYTHFKSATGFGLFRGRGDAAGNQIEITRIQVNRPCAANRLDGPAETVLNLKLQHPTEPTGVLHQIDESKARWGLALMAPGGAGGVVTHPLGTSLATIINDLRVIPTNTTGSNNDDSPLGGAMWDLMRYHTQEAPAYFPTAHQLNNPPLAPVAVKNWDPWFEWETGADAFIPCRASNILVISDGNSQSDQSPPIGNFSDDTYGAKPGPGDSIFYPNPNFVERFAWPPPMFPWWEDPKFTASGNGTMRDVALWGNVGGVATGGGDLRGGGWDGVLPGKQSVASFYVFAFGNTDVASTTNNQLGMAWLMWTSAINGSFIDRNANGKPDLQIEWDRDVDGKPDGFFSAEEGGNMEIAIIQAIAEIINRTASGTAVSVLNQSNEGEAAIVQTFFDPLIDQGIRSATWVGQLRSLWLDRFGNLREDKNSDGRLVLKEDRIAEFGFDQTTLSTFVELYDDANGDGVKDSAAPAITVPVADLSTLFDGGLNLFQAPATSRTIYTHLNPHTAVPTDPFFEFSNLTVGLKGIDSDSDSLSDYFAFPLTMEAALIDYVRGADPVPNTFGWRERKLNIGGTISEWKLGDIAFSTPVIVGAPDNRFDLIYGDTSYVDFFNDKRGRRQAIYTGSNSGMLHAFNLGKSINGDDPLTVGQVEEAFYETAGFAIGEEMWGFIPYNALPHLQWLLNPSYCHAYYVDLSPQIFDVPMFEPDADHVNGWGSILIGGTRFGCGIGTFGPRDFGPAYFIVDVTVPESPKLLWEFTHPDLNYATVEPTVARIGNTADGYHWYLILGSGPDDTNFKFKSASGSKMLVVQLDDGPHVTGGQAFENQMYWFDLPAPNADEHVNRAVPVDADQNYGVEVIYLSTTITRGGGDFDGRIVRVATKNDPDPTTWELSVAYESDAPFSVAPRAVSDGNDLWLLVGTGRYYDSDDKTYGEQQVFMGIKDSCNFGSCTHTYGINDLEETSSCLIDIDSGTGDVTIKNCASGKTTTQILADVMSAQGWFINLPLPFERVVSRPVVQGQTVVFTTFQPGGAGAICAADAGDSLAYILDLVRGVMFQPPQDAGKGVSQLTKTGARVLITRDTGELGEVANPFVVQRLTGFQNVFKPLRAP